MLKDIKNTCLFTGISLSLPPLYPPWHAHINSGTRGGTGT